jgi:hypothetical protein
MRSSRGLKNVSCAFHLGWCHWNWKWVHGGVCCWTSGTESQGWGFGSYLCPILLPSQTAHHSVWIEIGRFGDEPRSMNFTLSVTFTFYFKTWFQFLAVESDNRWCWWIWYHANSHQRRWRVSDSGDFTLVCFIRLLTKFHFYNHQEKILASCAEEFIVIADYR